MKREPTDRLRAHLDRGDRAFIPPDRIRRIRWEECVLRARQAREGVSDAAIVHGTCHCGSMECVGVPSCDEESTFSFPSDAAGGPVVVARSAVLTRLRVEVRHDPPHKFALRVRAPSGAEVAVVSAPDPTNVWCRGSRYVPLDALVGSALQGEWHLTVRDRTLGDGERRVAWCLLASFRRGAAAPEST